MPQELFQLKHLRALNLGRWWRDASGQWQEAPTDLGHNHVAPPLEKLADLSDLRELWLGEMNLANLSVLAGLERLQSIDCFGTDVSDLTPLAGLQALQSVHCSNTQVSDLAPLAGLQALESIECSQTQVSDLAPLAGLQALQSIICSNTQSATLSRSPAFRPSSRSLAPIRRSAISRRSPAFRRSVDLLLQYAGSDLAPLAGLQALQSIFCSNTQVSDLAPLAGLQALQSIFCSRTLVIDLAPLAEIASLRQITANGLRLAASSIRCLGLRGLEEFKCFGTRLRGVPAEVLSQDAYSDNCLAHLRAHVADLADGAVEARDVKLMVLGNGRVGKTQLCRRLESLGYDDALPSTHGIVVESFDLSHGARADFARVHIWDFGGQDIYHGAHSLFMRANAVFVLVWAPEFESGVQVHGGLTFRNYPLRYWVDYVRQLGGQDAAVLIVQTRCDTQRDRRASPVSDDELREAFGAGYCEILQFSALSDRGLPGLKEKLGEAIEFLREAQGVARIGASRQRVKARLETLRDEDAKLPQEQRRFRWLTPDDFRRICAEEGLVSEPKFLLNYLHNSGVVFYREGLFEDRIVLDQSWALEAIYAVFKRDSCLRQLRQLRGRFTRPLLDALVWAGRPVSEQKLLIGMMESCGICFEVREGDEKAGIEAEYIAPDLLPERATVQTELDGLWGRQPPEEQATYAYDLLLPGLLRALTSRIGSQAGVSAFYWRDGLCVYEASTGAHALIEQAMDAGWSGQLTISTRGGRARDLLERLKEWVEQEQNRLGLRPKEHADEGDPEFARREPTDDVEKAPDMRFAAQPRTDWRRYVSYAWNDPSDPQREEQVDRLCEAAVSRGAPIIRDKTAMSFRDSISRFMKEIGQGDRVFVFLSDKYLKSPFCMFELFEIWRNSRLERQEFRAKVRLYRRRTPRFSRPETGLNTPNTGAPSMTNWRPN